MTFNIATHRITTLSNKGLKSDISIMTLSIVTLSIMTLSIMTLSTTTLPLC